MSSSPTESESTLRDRVAAAINAVRPALQADGGDVEFVDVNGQGVVQVRLRGACCGCPSAQMTLKFGIERSLKAKIPEVTEVVCV